ncbi:hypothetical protein PR002_g33175 [Phytophthora rubi]|uniref:Reverse transcriptase n=1 Tax=Phytophthora rubi TaxID=129364 RepID=A0A6A3G0V3_9STRA|nr:hypothetical protein PR002_g33175 [Phytophthora rubi]
MDAGRGKAQALAVTTRSAAARTTTRRGRPPEVLEELVVQRLRLDRIRVAQDEEVWIVYLKKYLRGDVGDLSRREVKNCQKLAPQYEEGESGLLYYQSRSDCRVGTRQNYINIRHTSQPTTPTKSLRLNELVWVRT